MKSFGKQVSGDGEFKIPTSICISSDRCFTVVVEYENSRIQVFTTDGEPVFKFRDSGPERLDHPLVCICCVDKFIVTDLDNNCGKCLMREESFCISLEKKETVMDY